MKVKEKEYVSVMSNRTYHEILSVLRAVGKLPRGGVMASVSNAIRRAALLYAKLTGSNIAYNPDEYAGLTQDAGVKKYLESGRSITSLEALNIFGAFRLSAIIHRLRHEHGLDITTTIITTATGKNIAQYSLNQKPE